MTRSNLAFRAGLLACLTLLAGFVALFLLAAFVYSGPERVFSLLSRPAALHSIWLSLWTSALSTALALLLAVPAAYALTRYSIRGRAALDVLLDLPIALPPLVAGFSLLLLFALLDRALGAG